MSDKMTGEDNVSEALIALVGILETRDTFTKDHSVRVSHIAVRFGKIMKLDSEFLGQVSRAALLHDIGMVGIPDAVLFKPGNFTPSERNVINETPAVAANILAPIKSLAAEREMILHHGERWDGSGYPDGLHGEGIPLGARLIAISEAIDAMTQNRSYRRARPISYCMEQLEKYSGSQFDPEIAQVAISELCKGLVRKTKN
ncbi:two-component system response regulator [Mariprofundus micogutta]|uniref:Two-component system response regulator n=1 Tax=Mariprofundus micogutta TaxID=1921010 RepID=A0A1L8CLR6_9PROT|nr:HD domain-containing phosphohydrolase [Mariprofundus micogutta]GAV19852.1 two-component system response regulator [Mariprofundus micogutta]